MQEILGSRGVLVRPSGPGSPGHVVLGDGRSTPVPQGATPATPTEPLRQAMQVTAGRGVAPTHSDVQMRSMVAAAIRMSPTVAGTGSEISPALRDMTVDDRSGFGAALASGTTQPLGGVPWERPFGSLLDAEAIRQALIGHEAMPEAGDRIPSHPESEPSQGFSHDYSCAVSCQPTSPTCLLPAAC